MATIVTFGISFLGLSFLFLSKHRETGLGRKNFLLSFLSRFDERSSSFLSAVHFQLYRLVQTVKFLIFVHIPEKGKVKINQTKESMISGYQKQKDVIMGKKELRENGSSSFFLRKMTENKNSNAGGERGKIEESL